MERTAKPIDGHNEIVPAEPLQVGDRRHSLSSMKQAELGGDRLPGPKLVEPMEGRIRPTHPYRRRAPQSESAKGPLEATEVTAQRVARTEGKLMLTGQVAERAGALFHERRQLGYDCAFVESRAGCSRLWRKPRSGRPPRAAVRRLALLRGAIVPRKP